MDTVKLIFYNRSEMPWRDGKVVIYQNPWSDEENCSHQVLAWHVIERCGKSMFHPFKYSPDIQVSARIRGSETMLMDTQTKDAFSIQETPEGVILKRTSPRSDVSSYFAHSITIKNELAEAADIFLYRNGKPFAVLKEIIPEDTRSITIPNTISIGYHETAKTSAPLLSYDMPNFKENINMEGIRSADIIMTGGGFSPNATGYEFRLVNIVS